MIFSGLNFKVANYFFYKWFTLRTFFFFILFFTVSLKYEYGKDYIKIFGLAQASTYEQRSFFIWLSQNHGIVKSYLNEIEKGKKS
jgi:hypothetical protein